MKRSFSMHFYFRKYFLKKSVKKHLYKILDYYADLKSYYNKKRLSFNLFSKCFFLTLPKRQQCLAVTDKNIIWQKNFTTGKLLNTVVKHPKYYKRSYKNIGNVVMYLKNCFKKTLKYIYFFRISNYNKRQHLFFLKLNQTIQPQIHFLLHKKSYVPIWQPQKRIKRTILRMLNKT